MSHKSVMVLVMLLTCCYIEASLKPPRIEKVVLDSGYHLTAHDVVTSDGYILTIQRLTRLGATNSAVHRTPVLMGHGLAADSEQWLFRPDQNLAFLLVDNGFDVWLGNFRGTLYGLRHKTLSVKSHKFWDFSWHENAIFDQAAMIDYVLRVSGRARLFTISYSMSCTTSLVLLSERPEYNSKILANVFFAPAAYFRHPSGLWQLTKNIMNIMPGVTKDATGRHIVNDKMPFSDVPTATFCFGAKGNNMFTFLCRALSEFFAGRHSTPISDKLLRLVSDRIPAGGSIRQFTHFGQSIATGGFRKYDFGIAKNRELYGSPEPPSYNLSVISSPIHFYYGQSDFSVSVRDATALSKMIPSIVSINEVPRYNHYDFVLAEDLDEAVNKKVLANFMSYL